MVMCMHACVHVAGSECAWNAVKHPRQRIPSHEMRLGADFPRHNEEGGGGGAHATSETKCVWCFSGVRLSR